MTRHYYYHSDDDVATAVVSAASAAAAAPVTHCTADAEVWMDHYSEELVTMWHMLLDWTRSGGWAILDTCEDTGAAFNDFCHFCYVRSSGRPPVV